MPITHVLHTSSSLFFFHILKDLTIPCRGREGRSGISKRQHPWLRMERRGKKEEEASREERMMKNKANARAAASGQRGISLLLRGLVDGRQRVS